MPKDTNSKDSMPIIEICPVDSPYSHIKFNNSFKMKKINSYFRPVADNRHACNMHAEDDAFVH